jgi:hypothetical protein
MIPLIVTVCSVALSVWILSLINVWLAMLWATWFIAGLSWFVKNIGRKSGPYRWYDQVLLVPVLPYAWVFGVTNQLCEQLGGQNK